MPSIIEKAIAKTYLKMVCNTIYKKVDEDDNAGKEKAYKSFHILAGYLESKGIGVIVIYCLFLASVIIISAKQFSNEKDSNKIYAFSSIIIALISCIISTVTFVMQFLM